VSGDPRQRLERARVRANFQRAAADYDRVAVLQREVGARLLERLDLLKIDPENILDLGCGTGHALEALGRRYPRARLLGLDLAEAMLRQARRKRRLRDRLRRRHGYLCADACALPLAADSVDLVFSNLTLQWLDAPAPAFAEVFRVLRPGGAFLFTSLGPDTLKELRASWSAADGFVHVSPFLDLHDLGDALLRAGLAEPVMDVERLTLTYDTVDALMRDLKTLGARNAAAGRPRGLTGKGRLARVRAAYEAYRDAQGRLPASYEVNFGLAWMADPKPPPPPRDGVAVVSLERLRRGRP